MIIPDSFIETKYYLKFSNIENYTDVSGTIGKYAVTKAGKIPQVRRNKDFTLQVMTFTFTLFSTTEVLRGQKFKASRLENGIEKDIFYGFVDTVDYDEDKDEYAIKIAHEFKYLQRHNIRKSELESVINESNCSRVLKKLVELVVNREIDFSIAEDYVPVSVFPETSLLSATFHMPMFWCVGLDIATSEPDEDATASYWDVFANTIGLLGCVLYFDGTKYIVKHYTQDENYDKDTVVFLDKNKPKYIPTNEMYYSCGFTAEYNNDLSKYTNTDPDELSEYFEYKAVIKNKDVATGITNLKVFLRIGNTDSPQSLNIGRNDSELEGQKLYIDDYWNQPMTLEYEETKNLPLSKDYDPINNNMSIVQQTPYDFQVTNYFYFDEVGAKKSLADGALRGNDSVYIEFNKPIDENSLNYIDIKLDGIIQGTQKSFMSTPSIQDPNTVRIKFTNFNPDGYTIYIAKDLNL